MSTTPGNAGSTDPESNFAFVNQADGATPGLYVVKCVDRLNLDKQPEPDDNAVSVTFRCKFHDVDQDVRRKAVISHATTARWVMAAPTRPAVDVCKAFVARQTISVPKLYLRQSQAVLQGASRFSDAPISTDPSVGSSDKRKASEAREYLEDSEAEEGVELSQVC